MIIESLLAIIGILLVLLILLTLKSKKVETKDVEAAISGTWIKLGLDEKIGAVESHAKDIRDSYKSFEQMLRVPTERSSFGEFSLEIIFSDQLPQDMYGIRERTLDGKISDAYIRSTVGIICIDSKFPLYNFGKMLDADDVKDKVFEILELSSYFPRRIDNILWNLEGGHRDKIQACRAGFNSW